jgi:general secretion pathway protein G
MRNSKKFRRGGFTLMELLLVMAILVIMASMVSFAFLNFQKNARSDAALSQISTLSTACKMYKMNVGTFPNDLVDLIALPSGLTQSQWRGPYMDTTQIPTDPWNNNYIYTPDGVGDRVLITSAGPDRQAGTADDVPTNAIAR